MKHEIEATQDHVAVKVVDLGGRKAESLASFATKQG